MCCRMGRVYRAIYLAFCTSVFARPPSILLSYRCASMMQSVSHNTSDGSVRLETNTPIPSLRKGDLLVKVAATALNRADLLQAKGLYPPPPGDSEILGLEIAGTVEEMSPEAEEQSGFKKGQKVMALVGGGGYAEYCLAPYQSAVPIPEGMDMITAASIPEAYLTAYQALVWNCDLKDNETALIHAAASGVGLAATQLAKSLWNNVTVITTASSAEKLALSKENGADVCINYKTQNFADEVLKATNNKGADVIVDFVGGSYWEKNMKSASMDSRMVILGLLGGAVTPSPANLGVFLRKRIMVRGSTLRSRSLDYKQKLTQELSQRVLPLFTAGKIKTTIDTSFPLAQVQQAHDRMSQNLNSGKIVLTVQ